MEAWGLHEQAAEARARLSAGGEAFGIYWQNRDIFELWAESWSCWRWISSGMAPAVRAGIDWVQVRALLDSEPGAKEWRRIKAGLKAMEAEALDVMYSQEH